MHKSLSRFLVLGCLLLLLSGCKSKVTKANSDKITEGMSLEDVEKILGRGSKQGDGSGIPTQVGIDISAPKGNPNTDIYIWESDNASITVYFFNGKVKTKINKGL